jgi:hypothetical protein
MNREDQDRSAAVHWNVYWGALEVTPSLGEEELHALFHAVMHLSIVQEDYLGTTYMARISFAEGVGGCWVMDTAGANQANHSMALEEKGLKWYVHGESMCHWWPLTLLTFQAGHFLGVAPSRKEDFEYLPGSLLSLPSKYSTITSPMWPTSSASQAALVAPDFEP